MKDTRWPLRQTLCYEGHLVTPDVSIYPCLYCQEAVDSETGVYVPSLQGYVHEWCENDLAEVYNEESGWA